MSVGRILYGLVFCALLPILLVAWAGALTAALPGLLVIRSISVGMALLAAGAALMANAMWGLRVFGGGLPMNAFPPPRLVTRGLYRLTPHPIYVGFVLACAGASLIAGSSGGLWIVTPLAAFGCAALVLGYERPDLQRRFGPLPRPLLSLPPAGDEAPGPRHRLSVFLLVLLPWLIAYEAIGHMTPSDGTAAFLPFERPWPVLPWTEWIYGSIYLLVLVAPLLAHRTGDLRRFAIAGLVGTAIGSLAMLVAPLTSPPRPFDVSSFAGRLLELERADGMGGRGAFPSFHVFWAIAAAWLVARSRPRWALPVWAWAAAITISCATTGMHALADLVAGAVLAVAALNADRLWSGTLRITERTANSWRDWRLGPVRIINHAAYAGLGAFVGVAGAGLLAGGESAAAIAGIALCALVGAGLWGQALVGSRTLLRPFGYYGSVIGATLGLLLARAAGADLWLLGAALATVAPWVQGVGRLRCLVQGCCHGAPTAGDSGIRYRHPLSRVCRIADLGGVRIHPTPLYSIASNAVIGLLLARLWSLAVPASFLAGMYLVLSGLSRFVEESRRGEPTTPIRAGLRVYQWFAAASVGSGAIISVLPAPAVPGTIDPDWRSLAFGLLAAAIYAFAMGVDFPASNRRFSRLA